jgi:DNA repair protein RadC
VTSSISPIPKVLLSGGSPGDGAGSTSNAIELAYQNLTFGAADIVSGDGTKEIILQASAIGIASSIRVGNIATLQEKQQKSQALDDLPFCHAEDLGVFVDVVTTNPAAEFTCQPTFVGPSKRPTKARIGRTRGGSRLQRELETYFSRIEQHLLERPDTLQDQELLELGLFIALGARDTRPIARALLARFGTLGRVIAARPIELSAFRGLGKKGVATLKLAQASAVNVLRKEVSTAPVVSSWDQLMDYLSVSLRHERVEEFHVLFLDGRGALIADEVNGRGTINQVSAYPREVVRRCLELNASAIIMVHNHPSGDPAPSLQDVVMTQDVQRAAATMGISLHDHLIIGRFGCRSLRQEKLL